jgi:hypothetical protein
MNTVAIEHLPYVDATLTYTAPVTGKPRWDRGARALLGDDAHDLLRRRFSVINVWRPIRGPLKDAPLRTFVFY